MKNALQSLLLIACTSVLHGCLQDCSQSNIVRTGFDEMRPWNRSSDAYTDRQARSGKYAIYTDANKEFSLTWEGNVNEMLEKGYSVVRASIWAKCADSVKNAQWVAAVNSPAGVNYIWKSTFISECKYHDSRGWRKAEVVIELPLNAPDAILKIYGWSQNKEEVILDDFELVLE